MNIVAAILIFTVIVVVHEFGHFLLAKKHGVGVPEFSVGMGPRIITFAKTKKGFVVRFFLSQKQFETREDFQDVTKYSWKLLPIGGSCAMVGEDEENDADNAFNNKGVWARFWIIFAGPFFNFILAFVFSVIIIANCGIDLPIVEYVYDRQPAAKAGIEVGDTIKSVNGHKITIGREIDTYLMMHPLSKQKVEVVYERDGKEHSVMLDPTYKTYLFGFTYGSLATSDTSVGEVTEGKPFEKAGVKAGDIIRRVNDMEVTNGEELGIAMNKVNLSDDVVTFLVERDGEEKTFEVKPEEYEALTLGVFAAMDEPMSVVFNGYSEDPQKEYADFKINPLKQSLVILKYSFIEVGYWIETTVGSLKMLFTGKLSMDDVSGPVGIVDTVGTVITETAKNGMKQVIISMMYMAVLLSANLGVMNLLPIPALDGGRIVFLLIEAVRGKPIDHDKEGYVNFAGFIILMILMLVIMYNDIAKLIH